MSLVDLILLLLSGTLEATPVIPRSGIFADPISEVSFNTYLMVLIVLNRDYSFFSTSLIPQVQEKRVPNTVTRPLRSRVLGLIALVCARLSLSQQTPDIRYPKSSRSVHMHQHPFFTLISPRYRSCIRASSVHWDVLQSPSSNINEHDGMSTT